MVSDSSFGEQPAVHRPVLLDEVLSWLNPRPGDLIVDGTVGAGGHAVELARSIVPGGTLLGLDRDPRMLALARQALAGLPVELIHAPYSQIGQILKERGHEHANAILLDLGLSSDQLAWSERGFSFSHEGPLDMRYDPSSPVSAADLINERDADELADIFYHLGEERFSRRIARALVAARARVGPIQSTTQLAEIVRRAIPARRGKIDPATRVFQALRIAVNEELEHLDAALARVASWLAPDGRVAVISFHSLEDRRVKQAFRNDPALSVLTKKPIVAGPAEQARNPRARSAKLRVAARCIPIPSAQTDPTA